MIDTRHFIRQAIRKYALLGAPQDTDEALEALNDMAAVLGLPQGKFRNPYNQGVPVPVPKPLTSLFATLQLQVRWRNPTYAEVRWAYAHRDGMTNGKDVGYLAKTRTGDFAFHPAA